MKKVVFTLSVLLCALLFCGCGESVIMIDTPYCPLALPEEFGGNVSYRVTSESPYTLEFSATDGPKLFALSFGGEMSDLIGTLPGETENTVIYATFFDLDESDSRYEDYARYQHGINTIIQHLIDDNDLIPDEIVEKEDNTTFEIQTSVVTLHYPNKWKNKVQVENTADKVSFSYKGDGLFDLVFSECENGYLLGTYNETPIYIVSHELDETKYSEDELYDIRAMSHAVNVILDHLMKDKNFTVN